MTRSDAAVSKPLDASAGSGGAVFTISEVPNCGQAGYQTVAAAAGGKVAFATLATTGKTPAECQLDNRTSATAPVYDICVLESSATGFTGAVVTSQPYAALMGVGLAVDKAGVPTLAYTGGPSAKERCGGSDLLVATAGGGVLGTPRTIAQDSQSTGYPADQATACAAQNVCNQGDATGYWPSLALDPVAGTLVVGFRDLHFGFGADDFASSDVEVARGDAYSIYTVDVARGGGTYLRAAVSPTGKAALVHYSADRQPAIWIDRETDQDWVSKKLFSGEIGEQLGFGISPQGLYSLAYYDKSKRMMMYSESQDGDTWTPADSVDKDGLTGQYPSLAFDGSGQPAVAYYRCNDYDPKKDDCSTEKDGLYLARRQGGVWKVDRVQAKSGLNDGKYPALAFLNGKAVIAFQESSFDPIASKASFSLHIAQEQ